MTLCTHIAIGKPHHVREIFDFCRTLLDTPAGTPVEAGPEEGSPLAYADGRKWIANPGGIGLGAWLWVYYGVDGPMRHVHDKWCTDDDGVCEYADSENPTDNGWAAIDVTFDTAYGYRGENNESCSDLHARLVSALGAWLDARGLPWKWQNEYTGEWSDRFDNLDAFGDAHRATGADAWFHNVVAPALGIS